MKSPATPNSPILLLQTRHTVNELGFRWPPDMVTQKESYNEDNECSISSVADSLPVPSYQLAYQCLGPSRGDSSPRHPTHIYSSSPIGSSHIDWSWWQYLPITHPTQNALLPSKPIEKGKNNEDDNTNAANAPPPSVISMNKRLWSGLNCYASHPNTNITMIPSVYNRALHSHILTSIRTIENEIHFLILSLKILNSNSFSYFSAITLWNPRAPSRRKQTPSKRRLLDRRTCNLLWENDEATISKRLAGVWTKRVLSLGFGRWLRFTETPKQERR